jgi:hypothetical protein
MSHELRTSIDIDASPESVCEVLVDIGAYASWNPLVTRADGALEVGGTVLEVSPGRRLRRLGKVGVRGVFDAEHTLTVSGRADGGARFDQDEVFRGLLVPALRRSLDRRTLPAFHGMNRALKTRAECAPAARAG